VIASPVGAIVCCAIKLESIDVFTKQRNRGTMRNAVNKECLVLNTSIAMFRCGTNDVPSPIWRIPFE
jgi:hypothetical protein